MKREAAEYFYKCLYEEVPEEQRPSFTSWYKILLQRLYAWKGQRIKTGKDKKAFKKYLERKRLLGNSEY